MALERIFCVVDPTTTNQRALRRAEGIAVAVKVPVHVYICINGKFITTRNADRDMTLAAEKERHEVWLDRLVQPLRDQGVEVTTEVESSDNWHEALVKAAQRSENDLIIKASAKKPSFQRRLLRTADWTLLRSATCPVLFVKAEEQRKLDKVLLAVNLQAEDEAHVKLTDRIIEEAHRIAGAFNTELWAANAYEGSENFVYPDALARRTRVDPMRCKVDDASPEALLREVTEKESIPMVIVGSIARKGLKGAVVGNTAERIIDGLQSDILVIMQH